MITSSLLQWIQCGILALSLCALVLFNLCAPIAPRFVYNNVTLFLFVLFMFFYVNLKICIFV